MTREQAAEIIRKEYKCVDRDCDIERSCGKCDLMIPSKEPILQAYDMAIQALQAQADGEYIKKSDMIDWLKDIRHKMKPQNYHTASEFEIAENQIWNFIQMLQMGALPTVAIPSTTGHWIDREVYDADRWKCSECGRTEQYKENYCPNCGADMRGDTDADSD